MIVTRTYEWPMGHRLQRHGGRCASVHGHTWHAEVVLRSADGLPSVQAVDSPSCGMVVDFGDVDRLVGPIIDGWDHGFMVEHSDPLVEHLRAFASECAMPQRLLVTPFTPTSENIAAALAEAILKGIEADRLTVELVAVKVSESPRSNAWWEARHDA